MSAAHLSLNRNRLSMLDLCVIVLLTRCCSNYVPFSTLAKLNFNLSKVGAEDLKEHLSVFVCKIIIHTLQHITPVFAFILSDFSRLLLLLCSRPTKMKIKKPTQVWAYKWPTFFHWKWSVCNKTFFYVSVLCFKVYFKWREVWEKCLIHFTYRLVEHCYKMSVVFLWNFL